MKKRIAILLALCLLLTGAAALAQEADAPKTEAVVAGAEEAVEAAEAAEGAAGQEEAVEDEGAAAEEDGAQPEAEEAGDGEDAGPEPAEEDPAEEGAAEEERGAFTLWFEEGFGLDIPDGWVSYPVTDQDRQAGVRYILGDGAAAHYLYILAQPTAMHGAEALAERIEAAGTLEKTANLMFADTPFVAFVDDGQDASGCAAVWGGEIVTFLFTPRSDSEFMATVTEVMETFRPL